MRAMQNGLGNVGLPSLAFPKTLRGLMEGKVSIVTGASHGIGAAAAIALMEAGAKVVLAARNERALEDVTRKIESGGGNALVAPTDVTDPASVKRLVDLTLERFGRLDAAFNNAGSGHMPAPLAEISVETTTVRSA
jgi:NAD(P)-dependent dehydrogenase (short-subunit alcohol dehydrogenase family)